MSDAPSPFQCARCSGSVRATDGACGECTAPRPKGGWPIHPYLGDLVAERYRIERQIGKGSSGEVYLARDENLPSDANTVVVKMLVNSSSENVRRRFQNEVRAARKIESAHAVRLFDAGIHREAPYLVMEYLRGLTLRSKLEAEERLPAESVLEIAEQVSSALVDMHARGVVHRDLKPDNLMLTSEDPIFVKVLDFGIVHLADDGATMSDAGTPRYMAPEQILHRAVDGQCDVYALGICLYEMLTGAAPFKGETVSDLLQAKLESEAESLEKNWPDVPTELARLVDRMLARDSASRPTAKAVLDTLRNPAVAQSAKPKRWRTIVFGAALALATAASVVTLRYRAPRSETLTVQDLARQEIAAVPSAAVVDAPTPSTSGARSTANPSPSSEPHPAPRSLAGASGPSSSGANAPRL